VSEEELRFIAEEVTGSMERAREEISGLVLVEIEIRGASHEFDIGRFHQDGSNQVAWDEKCFSVDGSKMMADGSKKPDQPHFRVCFFLHYFEPTERIVSQDGEMVPGEVTEMPERLRKVCVYEHPG